MNRYALIVIDMQNDFVLEEKTAVKGAKATLPAIARAITVCREKNIPIFHIIRSYEADGGNAEFFRRGLFRAGQGFCIKGTYGAEIVQELTPQKDDEVIIKSRFSAFFETDLHTRLKKRQITHLLVAGTQYPNCIRSTAVDALSLDFFVTVLTDCCSAQTSEIAKANIFDLQNMGICCIDFSQLKW